MEFRRHLRKYLEDIQSLNNVKSLHRTNYTLFDSIILPITEYLGHEGVDFRFSVEVTDLQMYPEGDPTTVSEIKFLDNGDECLVTLDPQDICLVTLGSTASGAVTGTNESAPLYLSSDWEDLMMSEWRLWQTLAQKSPKFGDPDKFLPRALQSSIETFTTTIQGTEFIQKYKNLTHDQPGVSALLSLTESNWSITISVPHQPVFPNQANDVSVICGYALNPSNDGDFVKKPMFACSGKEVFTEVLSHLDFPVEPILASATTIPCGMPMGTAPFLTRSHQDRPQVIPRETTNIACVGQFVEVPEDTTLDIEYSARTAQMAVFQLFGLPKTPARIKKNILLEVFDLIV